MDGTIEERAKEYQVEDSGKAEDVEWLKLDNYSNKLFKAKSDIWFADVTYRNYHQMEHLKVREDDTFVVTFPKSGTTWVQEVVYLLQNNFDTAKAKSGIIEQRMPCIDYQDLASVEQIPSPRILKVHWALPILPKAVWEKKAKVIYVVRNPKDVAVSFYHFCTALQGLMGFSGDFETCAKQFLDGPVYAGPWWLHVNHGTSNSLAHVVHYEDLIKNPREQIKEIAKYLGKTLTDEQLDIVQKHCSFETMRENPSVNFSWMIPQGIVREDFLFMRKGKVGDWTNYFTVELSKAFDEMVEHKCTNFDFKRKLNYGVSHEEFVKMKEAQQAMQEAKL